MNLLVVTGGRHPYEESTPILAELLKQNGHEVRVTEDPSVLVTDAMQDYDALVFNTRREQEITLAQEQQVALTQYVGGGKGFVCLHISGCRPESWPEYHDVTGGGWISGESCHPPYGQFSVKVSESDHPCAQGIEDFVTNDELYIQLGWKPGNNVFLTAELEEGTHVFAGHSMFMAGGTYPMAWTRNYGNGKVFKTTLGHNGLSVQNEQFQRLILNGVNWTTSAE